MFTCEWKYDGERAQVHYYTSPPGPPTLAATASTPAAAAAAGANLATQTVRIFSRNSEDTTPKYPDLTIVINAAVGNPLPSKTAAAGSAGGAADTAAHSADGESILQATNGVSAAAEGAEEAPGDADATAHVADGGEAAVQATADVSVVAEGAEAAQGPADGDAEATSLAVIATGGPPRVTSCILDGEVVAYDRIKNVLLPFQQLSTRSRKDVAIEDIRVQVVYVAFDLIYLNGVSLLRTPLRERRRLLREHFQEVRCDAPRGKCACDGRCRSVTFVGASTHASSHSIS